MIALTLAALLIAAVLTPLLQRDAARGEARTGPQAIVTITVDTRELVAALDRLQRSVRQMQPPAAQAAAAMRRFGELGRQR